MFYSELESKLSNYSVSRKIISTADWSASELKEEIIRGKYDICRVKVLADDIYIFNKLADLGYTYDLYTLNAFLTLEIKEAICKNDDFYFMELDNAAADIEYKNMLIQTISNKTWVEYENSKYKYLINHKIRFDLAINHYLSISKNDDSFYTAFLCHKGKKIGFVTGEKRGKVFFGNMVGILPEYRSLGYMNYMYENLNQMCWANGIELFDVEINMFNMSSFKAAIRNKLIPSKVFLNLNLYPFLHINSSYEEVYLDKYDAPSILQAVQNRFKGRNILSFRELNYINDAVADCLFCLSPINSEIVAFHVIHLFSNFQIIKSFYFDIQ